MPHTPQLYDIIKWLHLVALAMGGGAAMVVLILVGFEADREDLKGLTAVLWKRTVSWAFRIAVLLGLILLAIKIQRGDQPFDHLYLHWKLALVVVMLAFSEMSPRALGNNRRGAPLLAFLLFLLVTFVAVNGNAFGVKTRRIESAIPIQGTLEKGQ
jgi:uncharacterized membrane protein